MDYSLLVGVHFCGDISPCFGSSSKLIIQFNYEKFIEVGWQCSQHHKDVLSEIFGKKASFKSGDTSSDLVRDSTCQDMDQIFNSRYVLLELSFMFVFWLWKFSSNYLEILSPLWNWTISWWLYLLCFIQSYSKKHFCGWDSFVPLNITLRIGCLFTVLDVWWIQTPLWMWPSFSWSNLWSDINYLYHERYGLLKAFFLKVCFYLQSFVILNIALAICYPLKLPVYSPTN